MVEYLPLFPQILGVSFLTIKPANSGTTTVITMVLNIDQKLTGIRWPTSNNVIRGVSTGARKCGNCC